MSYLTELEKKVQMIYDESLKPLASHYEYPLPTSSGEAIGQPTVLFLGNHSSGKSSFINHLLESEIQKTGLAPVDDGFTVITYGETENEYDGQTVVSHPQMPFKAMERFGPKFLSHFRLKTRPLALLKSLTLVDSPGMIGAAVDSGGRDYDFTAVVRHFAQRADLILFFFDPDKPGTTGETMSVFTQALDGISHKLLILMHKVDKFANIRDFARAYGALCWNLSKVIPTKDLPHIFNTYVPSLISEQSGERIPLEDFDVSRKEVLGEIERAPARRADNVVTALYNDARQLSMHAQVCSHVVQKLWRTKLKSWGITAGLVLLTVLVTLLASNWGWTAGAAAFIGGLLVAALSIWIGRQVLSQLSEATLNGLDPIFEKIYARQLALEDRADLRALWEGGQARIHISLKALGPMSVPGPFKIRKLLARVEKTIKEEVPQLRRGLETEADESQETTK